MTNLLIKHPSNAIWSKLKDAPKGARRIRFHENKVRLDLFFERIEPGAIDSSPIHLEMTSSSQGGKENFPSFGNLISLPIGTQGKTS